MTIPTGLRVPFVYVEFDPSRAFQGPSILRYKALLIGQRFPSGIKPAGQVDRLTSADHASRFYGEGSNLALMAKTFFANNKVSEVYAAALDDAAGSAAAVGSLEITGIATVDGTLAIYIAGKRLAIAVNDTDSATDIGDAVETAINSDASVPVIASNASGVVTLTAGNKGEIGNDIDIRANYYDGEALPEGVGLTINPMASGSGNPDIGDIIDILGDEWYNLIIAPYTDGANLDAMETELADRFGPLRMIDGLYITAKTGSLSTLTTWGNGRNSPHVCTINANNIPNTPWEVAAATGAVLALEGQADPARPFQTLELKGILPPLEAERFTLLENNQLLFDGISTFMVDQGGKVRVQRLITMYQTNAQGAPDIAYLDVNTMLVLMYLRYDFRNHILTKYARAKLADDGVNVGSGQHVITPSIGKAEAIAKFRQWEAQGLVEG